MTPGTAKHKLEINKYPHFTQQKAEYEETKKKKKKPKSSSHQNIRYWHIELKML